MNFEIAAVLEVLSGILTGWAVAVIVRPDATRPLMVAAAFAGALFSSAVFGMLLLVGSVLAFGDRPSFGMNMLLTFLMDGIAVFAAWCAVRLQGAFHIPTGADVDELIDTYPSENSARAWLIGFLVAAVLIWFGWDCASRGKATIGTTLWNRDATGSPAIAYGVAWIATGLFIHVHFLWGTQPRLRPYGKTAKLVSLVLGCFSFMVAFLSF
jgi:hypothetical protein